MSDDIHISKDKLIEWQNLFKEMQRLNTWFFDLPRGASPEDEHERIEQAIILIDKLLEDKQ